MESLKTILKSVREYKLTAILSPIFVGCEVIFECLLPLIMASLIDNMTGESMTPIYRYGVILIVLAFASLFCGIMSGRVAATAACGFSKNLRGDLFNKIQDFSFTDIDKFSSSSLVTRMTTDVTNIQNAYQMIIRGAVRTPFMMIFSVVMAMLINVKIALIFVATIPILGFALFKIALSVHPVFKRIFKKYDALNNSVQENVSGIRVVKSFVREDFEIKKFDAASDEVRKDFTFAEKILALNGPVMSFCIYVAMLAVNYVGARMIIASGGSDLTTGQLSSLINYGVQMLMAIMMLSFMFVMVSMAAESVARVAEVLEHESTLKNPENGKKEVESGDIVFDHVYFKYREDSENYALSDINLNIPSGATVGIIGGTGSAKSSLIQLISRLYDATEGSVKLAGVDVRDYDLVSLRDQVAVVLQKNILFSGTIVENLRWGKEDASLEEIEHACKLSQADEFIQQFPDKYNTYIEQGGTNVSGGQKQRLCIARALLKKPRVIILDDSTSAVDTKTDALIRRAFASEIPDTTKIIIAQRVSSVQDADIILVMDGGRIVEQGTHDELVALGGIYNEVFESQTKSKEAV